MPKTTRRRKFYIPADAARQLKDPSYIPRVSWEEFLARAGFKQGEHISILGRTGSGKSYLALAIMQATREYCCAFGPKPRDDTLSAVIRKYNWTRVASWDERPTIEFEHGKRPPPTRFMVWPPYKRMEDADKHPRIFGTALREAFAEGRWAVFMDEITYYTKRLKMEPEMKTAWQQGRSLKLTMIGATQRPYYAPREFLSEATHVLIFSLSDEDDIKRLSDIGGADKRKIMQGIRSLVWDDNEFLYVDARTGLMMISKAPSDFI